MLTQERGDDGRRCLIGSQTMGIGSTHDRCLQQAIVLIHTHQSLYDEDYKTEIVLRSLTCRMEQYASIGAKTPVVVLTRTIHACKWFLVQQDTETMLVSHTLHQAHQEHVVIDSQVALLVDRSQLKLVRSHLVMTGLARNAQFESLDFQVLHKGLHTLWDGTEVMVVHLLVLGGIMSHEGTSRQHQVWACRVETLIHEEVLLFPTEVGLHLLHLWIEVVAHLSGCLAQGMERTKQRSLVVQSLSRIRNKYSRNTKCIVDNEHRGCRIPSRIATSLEGVANTTVRE